MFIFQRPIAAPIVALTVSALFVALDAIFNFSVILCSSFTNPKTNARETSVHIRTALPATPRPR
jgi:hypothetical protein